jgi:quercetin dioxygenase-like cupin family protein
MKIDAGRIGAISRDRPDRGDTMEIEPKKPSIKGPAEWFTGDVWIDPIAVGEEPSRIRVAAVRFTPGAHTAWHSHTLGQTLHVTEGAGLVQSRGGDIVNIHAGDVVYTPPDEWHWHGAAPDHFMTHISMTEGEETWGAHVTDTEYRGEQ